MSMQGNVMQMREVKDGLAIPAHGDVKLTPGGYHLMLTGLKHPLVKGETAKVTLTFERAGAVTVDFAVVGVGAASGDMKGMDMKGMKM
jgi:copper(I)-binding protein